ncbi:MAG: SixA phosphatase family protein [Bryobacteraceae bacterium]
MPRESPEAGAALSSAIPNPSHKLEVARSVGIQPDLALTSPCIRALETAELASLLLNVPKPQTSDALLPLSRPQAVWSELRQHADQAWVLIVSHEPWISEAVSFLLGCSRIVVNAKEGSLICLELDAKSAAPKGVLCWMLTAELAAAARKRQNY